MNVLKLIKIHKLFINLPITKYKIVLAYVTNKN